MDPKLYKRLDWINNFCWMLENLFCIAATLVEMSDLQTAIKLQMTKVKQVNCSPGDEQYQIREELKSLKQQYVKKCLSLASNLVDIPPILYFFENLNVVSTGKAGLCGTLSSLLGLYGLWGK